MVKKIRVEGKRCLMSRKDKVAGGENETVGKHVWLTYFTLDRGLKGDNRNNGVV